jgi:RTX calcium-binding nonapeptide repeat (4 copies)
MYSATAVTAAGGGSRPFDRRAARVLAVALLAAALAASALLLAPDHRRQEAALPQAAQSTVSGVLGRDDVAFRSSPSPHGFRMANARHGLVASFGPAGVRVQAGAARLRLALQSWGYGDALRRVAQAAPAARANRIDYRRGPLTEWYVNGPGNDTIDAGLGNDHVRAGDGNNRIQLKGGNDDATAGTGDDTIDGGLGIDICNPGGGVNTVTNCEL